MDELTLKRDLHLWSALKQGDSLAFGQLYEAYFKTLYNYGYKLSSGQVGLVEDCIQDLFVDLWRMRNNLAPAPTSVKFYLLGSLRRKLHRNAEPTVESLDEEALEHRLLPPVYQEESVLPEEALITQLRKAMEALPIRELEVVSLRYYEQMSVEQIATMLDISEQAVRKRLRKAMRSMRSNPFFTLMSAFWLLLYVGYPWYGTGVLFMLLSVLGRLKYG